MSIPKLTCTGGEFTVGECSWPLPDEAYFGPALDFVVFCGEAGHPTMPQGAVWPLQDDGAPSLSGMWILEVRVGGAESPVCDVTLCTALAS